MSLIRFNPARPVKSPFDELFSDFFEGELFPARANTLRSSSLPAANIKEDEKSYHVELAAPGMKKDDFKIELDENLLSIRTEKQEEHKEENEKYTKREFNYTSFVRSFRLPEEVNQEEISASYKDGILKLEIPKLESEKKPKVRAISVK